MKNIVEIEAGKIFPHPKNPRKDLGDLTELAESIKANGIMQNLTVVRNEDDTFTVIIGHRRLKAASLAGLLTVPCVISEMDEKKQLSTMLLENMQRSDLTALEQAEGFQLMMDLGETAQSISSQTGFSETTVRHRLKLLELDRKELAAASMRGGTLRDYIELEKIKDSNLKNDVLRSIGTANFDYRLKLALNKEKWQEKKAGIIKLLSSFASLAEDTKGLSHIRSFSSWSNNDVDIPNDKDKIKYFYTDAGDFVYLYKEITAKEQQEKEKLKEEQRQKEDSLKRTKAALSSATKIARELRREFILNFRNEEKFRKEICSFAVSALICSEERYGNISEEVSSLLHIDEELSNFEIASEAMKMYSKRPLYAVLVSAYLLMEDESDDGYYDYCGCFNENTELSELYRLLTAVGYEMSDEEKALQNGTSELFAEKA